MNKKILTTIGILLSASLGIYIFGEIYEQPLPKIVEEINNSALGAMFTAFVTVLLLQGQTATEEARDKNIKVFEKKQDIYHEFLEKLKAIIQDGEVTIAAQGKQPGMDKNIDELKDLIFQLGYIQMHSSHTNTSLIFKRVAKVIEIMNDFASEANKQKEGTLTNYYATLSEEVFGIISILKTDLYGSQIEVMRKEDVQPILEQCGLYIENTEFNRSDVQNYFWDELQNQLLSKGYVFDKTDFSEHVKKYYARPRHRWFSFSFPIYIAKSNQQVITFIVEIENGYYYGFLRPEANHQFPELMDCIEKIATPPPFDRSSQWWYAYKNPNPPHGLDFWKLDSPGFQRLKDGRKRQQLIRDIAEEMHGYIQKFIKVAEESNL